MPSFQDRADLQDVLTRYCYAVDDRDWPAFRRLFTDDAELDYSAFGGPKGGVGQLVDFLSGVLSGVAKSQHTISTTLLEGDGDRIAARTAAQVMMVSGHSPQAAHVSFTGLWYHDTLVKTATGWRIAARTQIFGWVHNNPRG